MLFSNYYFPNWNIIFHCLLFKMFYIPLVFITLTIISLSVIFFVFILLWFVDSLIPVNVYFSSHWKTFGHYFLICIPPHPYPIYPLLLDSKYLHAKVVNIVSQALNMSQPLSFFLAMFFLCFSLNNFYWLVFKFTHSSTRPTPFSSSSELFLDSFLEFLFLFWNRKSLHSLYPFPLDILKS